MNDDLSMLVCPNKHAKLRRLYSSPVVIFKGSGFYVNDHRSKTTKIEHGQGI
jgi:predicted nucleic acid-binding Zn ribbon protein